MAGAESTYEFESVIFLEVHASSNPKFLTYLWYVKWNYQNFQLLLKTKDNLLEP